MSMENPPAGNPGGSENGLASGFNGNSDSEFVQPEKLSDRPIWLVEYDDDLTALRTVDPFRDAAVMPDELTAEFVAEMRRYGNVEIFQSRNPASQDRAQEIARALCDAEIAYEIVGGCSAMPLIQHIERGLPAQPFAEDEPYGIEIYAGWSPGEPRPDFRADWEALSDAEKVRRNKQPDSAVLDNPEILAAVAAKEAKAKRVNAMMARLVDADGLEEISDPEWLIKGWLTRDTLARINGEPNTGKSLVALDWAGCVGTGTPWHGQPTEKGTVLYVIAEGVRGFKKRKRAWVKHYGKSMSGVLFYPEPIQIKKPDSPKAVDQWQTLTELCEEIKPALIVLDTQSRVTVGVEENSATDMGVIVERLETVRRATGACVLLAHHTPKGGEGGRGSGTMAGAINTEFMMIKRGRGLSSVMTLENIKEKDEEDGKKILLRFKVYAVDDRDPFVDDPMTSVVLVHEEDETAEDVIPIVADSDDNRAKAQKIVDQVWPHGRFTKAEACGMFRQHGQMATATAYRMWDKLIEDRFIESVPHATTGNPTEKYRRAVG